MSGIYAGFAYYYDDLMSDIPYDRWARNICSILKEHGIENGLVCELGCGTGEMTKRLKAEGYDMIGIDVSEDMLLLAREKQYEDGDGSEILYLLQDMREMELFGTVRAVVSVCDSMNYLTESADLERVFQKVNNYLDAGGLFIFDMKSEYFFINDYGDGEFSETDEDGGIKMIWQNHYDKEKRLNSYRVKISEEDEEAEGGMIVTSEEHIQRAYLPGEVVRIGVSSGMEHVKTLDADSMRTPDATTRRFYFIFREKRQENKLYI